MNLTVLGCSGSYPGPGMACSGYLVRTDRTTIWLDAGSGTMANLQRHVSIADVDAVVLTHAHVDHWSDVRSLAVAAQYYLKRPKVPVYGPGDLMGFLRRTEKHLEPNKVSDGDELSIGDLNLKFSATTHSVPTVAVRLDGGGRSLAYSSDTGPEWELSALGTDFDLALVEATYLADAEGSAPHLSARQAGETAKRAGARRLLVTHIAPVVDREAARTEAAAAYGGAVEVAAENQTYDV